MAPGHPANNPGLRLLTGAVPQGGHLAGDRGYDAARPRGLVRDAGPTPRIPSLANRAARESVGPNVCRGRDAVEQPINGLEHLRRVAARHAKLAASHLAMVTLAATRLRARFEAAT